MSRYVAQWSSRATMGLGPSEILGVVTSEATTPWAWASLPGLWRPDRGPTWVGREAENFGGRWFEGFGLLTSDARRCWITSERRLSREPRT